MSEALYKKCYRPTPVQKGGGCWYKRDDLFKPFDDSPINGTKLRQCIWLMRNKAGNAHRVVSAASIKSPQLPMVTRVAKAFGKDVLLAIGSPGLATARKSPMVALAEQYGAQFVFSPCAYNSALQSFGKAQVEDNDFFLEYGISTHDEKVWKAFYSFGGLQVKNIPDDIDTITITAGSCNSVLSVMIGLHNEGKLEKYHFNLVGVGPSKYKLLKDRFIAVTGLPLPEDKITYFPLHEDGVYEYADRQKFERDGIVFHPTYEGKMMKWLNDHHPEILDDPNNLVWIVGSEPKL